MALFNLPVRKEIDIETIVKKTVEQEKRPTLKLNNTKGKTSIEVITEIARNVEEQLGDDKKRYDIITTDEQFIAYCQQAKKDGIVSLDTETTGLDSILVNLVGVCMYSPSQKPVYVPVGHISVITENPVANQVSLAAIKKGMEIIKDSKIIFHSSYYDLVIIYQNTGVRLKVYWDTLVASFLLNENESHNLKDLYAKYVLEGEGEAHHFKDLFEGIPFCYVPYMTGGIYGAKDAEMTYELYKFQLPFLTPGTEECEESDLGRVAKLYYEEELPIIDVLVDMKLRGVHIDLERAREIKEKYENLYRQSREEYNKKVSKLKTEIEEYNKRCPEKPLKMPPNPASPDQMRILFYEILGVPKGICKKESDGTGKKVIKAILESEKFKDTPAHDIVESIQKYKSYETALKSFIYKIPEVAIAHGGTVHCNFHSVGVHTGRLSSSDFNLQNIPAKYGDIRNMFTAGEGRCFVGGDFSRQEVAICAIMSNSQGMLRSFIENKDIYSSVAELAYKTIDSSITYEDCLEHNPDGTVNKEGKQRRSAAKAIVLGILYSKQIPSIAADLNISVDAAQSVYDSIMKAFPDLREWMTSQVKFAETHGYVEGYFGRRRRLPELFLPEYEFIFDENKYKEKDVSTKKYYKGLFLNKLKKAKWRIEKEEVIYEAKQYHITIIDNSPKISKTYRQIINSLVQGSSADCTKRAMLLIHNNKRLQEIDCKLELTIHDKP